MKILTINAGSASHKLALYDPVDGEPVDPIWKASVDRKQDGTFPILQIEVKGKVVRNEPTQTFEPDESLREALRTLWDGNDRVVESPREVQIIGHRVVHGGVHFELPVMIDNEVKERIRKLIPLAPLHNRLNLEGIESAESIFPGVPQMAVFDTAFHVTMPEYIKTYPLPLFWKEKKEIRRYGFHGINHQYCAERAIAFLRRNADNTRMINCHLGNGCSLCAVRGGKSFETTMGLTPLEGVMMGTRSGSVDPGILLYLMREHGMSGESLDFDLNEESGLKGIAGHSDMRLLLEEKKLGKGNAELAVEMFVHRLKTSIGALTVSLGGCDILCFTGGIGENASYIREAVCEGLRCLGVAIDKEKNRSSERGDRDLTGENSGVSILVLPAEEERMIARFCFNALNALKP